MDHILYIWPPGHIANILSSTLVPPTHTLHSILLDHNISLDPRTNYYTTSNAILFQRIIDIHIIVSIGYLKYISLLLIFRVSVSLDLYLYLLTGSHISCHLVLSIVYKKKLVFLKKIILIVLFLVKGILCFCSPEKTVRQGSWLLWLGLLAFRIWISYLLFTNVIGMIHILIGYSFAGLVILSLLIQFYFHNRNLNHIFCI